MTMDSTTTGRTKTNSLRKTVRVVTLIPTITMKLILIDQLVTITTENGMNARLEAVGETPVMPGTRNGEIGPI